MDKPPADNIAALPWRERADLQGSVHGPVLRAFHQTMRQINAISVMILATPMTGEDKNQAMECVSTAATRLLQANLIYVEKCVLSHGASAGEGAELSPGVPPEN